MPIVYIGHMPHIPRYYKVAYVYGIFCVEGDSGFVKVGFSTSPFARVSAIASGSPLNPCRVGMIKAGDTGCARMMERRLHMWLSSRRVAQEWFKFDLKDEQQKAAFEGFSYKGFEPGWNTFPFEAMKKMLKEESEKGFKAGQKKKRTADVAYDARWLEGTKDAGRSQSYGESREAKLIRRSCKLSSLK